MGSECNLLPILFFAFMSQTITAIENNDIITPQSVVSGLCVNSGDIEHPCPILSEQSIPD
jgi:hypothetical protein